MCPLAIYLSENGYQVYGYDDNLQPPVANLLKKNNIEVVTDGERLKEAGIFVYSSAIKSQHPLSEQVRKHGLRQFRRGEFLAEVLKGKKLVAVVGSHGKTTTTAMLIHCLERLGFDFGYVLGAFFKDPNKNPAKVSHSSDWVVAEVDESDGTIEKFSPELTLVVNFDWDHPDRYKSPKDLEDTFKRLFNRTKKTVVLPKEFETLAKDFQRTLCTFGENGDYTFNAVEKVDDGLAVTLGKGFGKETGVLTIVPVYGLFNAMNYLGALSVCKELLDTNIAGNLDEFCGVNRRQDLLYKNDNIRVMADYAHHPAEISAFLESVSRKEQRECFIIFQPHRYTRTKAYAKEFAAVFETTKDAQVYLLPVYAASEQQSSGEKTEAILKAAGSDNEHMCLIETYTELEDRILPSVLSSVLPVDVFFIGAGDIEHWAYQFVNILKEKRQRGSWTKLKESVSEATVLKENEILASKTTLRVGGAAKFYAEPANVDDLMQILKWVRNNECPMFVLGRGSNVVVLDEGFDGLVLRLNHEHWRSIEVLKDDTLKVGAGIRLKELCGSLCKLGYTGFEFWEGIPGTLGGALRMNAGAMGKETFDVVESVSAISSEGSLIEYKKKELTVSYRSCKELQEQVAIGAIIKLEKAGAQTPSREIMESFSQKRKSSQPKEASAGCMFKNPEGNYAGKLIEEAGLKGSQYGGAEISTIHGNFIVNKKNAKCADVIALVRKAREEVRGATGIDLQPEVLLFGKKWSELL